MASSTTVNGHEPNGHAAGDHWRTLVIKKRHELKQDFPEQWCLPTELLNKYTKDGTNLIGSSVLSEVPFLSSEEIKITEELTAAALTNEIRENRLSSLAVTTAFAKRAAIAQQLTSCLTEIRFPEALERARYLDDYLKQHGKVVGPLHGLPISVKDSFQVKGLQSTVGYVEFLKHPPADRNSPLVDLLLDLGAVIYVKTNIPQVWTMMTGDSENNIFGRTLNPHNTSLTAGGSSGGEGALVAFKGSPLGVGTDIAGSIRIPSLCCGVYGFKPTADRIPFGGQVSGAMEGLPGIKPSAGPLANSIEDLELFMSTVLDAQPWRYDATACGAPRHQLKSDFSARRLRIGVLGEDPHFPLHPPVRRALATAAKALQAKGHHLVNLDQNPPHDVAFGNRLAFQYFIYGPHIDHMATSGEPAVTSVAKAAHPMFTGPFPVDMALAPFEKINELHNARAAYSEAWRKTWVEHELDVVLAPGAQNTAVPHDTFGWPPYTLMWNLLDYPACMLPYGRASQELDPQPFAPDDEVQPKYDPVAVNGAPCAIQVVAPCFQDEVCLAAAGIIDQVLRQASNGKVVD